MAPINRLITGKVNLNSDFFSSRVFKRDPGETGDQKSTRARASIALHPNEAEESKIDRSAAQQQTNRNPTDDPFHTSASNGGHPAANNLDLAGADLTARYSISQTSTPSRQPAPRLGLGHDSLLNASSASRAPGSGVQQPGRQAQVLRSARQGQSSEQRATGLNMAPGSSALSRGGIQETATRRIKNLMERLDESDGCDTSEHSEGLE